MPHSAVAQQIRDNLHRVRDQIAAAAESAQRDPAEICLVGVTKYVDAARAAMLLNAGCHDLGESRPQQLWEKAESAELAAHPPAEPSQPPRWHMIGHMQRNKVARTLPFCSLVHSVDSERLMRAINDYAHEDRLVDALLEINISGDAAKHGFSPVEAHELVGRLNEFAKVRVSGLMTMAAREGGPTVAQRNFAALRELRDQLQRNCPAGVELNQLSMGMSGDFEEAIAEGATLVRVGSSLWTGVEPA